MASVGERIRQERESRNTSLDDMSVATGIGQSYLESLEKGEYHELPGPAFGKLYIRAYAEVLGFDPQPWIDDYDREHRLLRGSAEYAAPARTGARPMADAIARWRESKMAAATSGAVMEDEAPQLEDMPPAAEPEQEVVAAMEPEPQREIAPPTVAPEVPPQILERPIPNVSNPSPRVAPRSRLPAIALVGVALVAAVIYIATRSGGEPEKPAIVASPPVEPVSSVPAPTPTPTPPPPPVAVALPPKLERIAPKVVPTAGDLTVTEFGVGRRVVNLALVDQSDRFTEGERVSFASRVVGGRRGNIVRHVWIYQGRAQQQITLRLGGSDYRTHTNKTVGKSGAWAVEARDDKGRVLARSEFTVVPR